MFNGYYLKINNVVYPTEYMVIPTYAVDDIPIIVKSYYDASYGKHIIKAPKNDIQITFDIRSMYNTEFPNAVAPLSNIMKVEYFDSKINGYKTDVFLCTSNLNPRIARQYNNQVLYEQMSVTLVRVVE